MARQTVTQLLCDGCAKPFEENAKGSSEGAYSVVGDEENRHVIDLCPDCTKELPEGTKKKRPGRKKGS